MEVGHHEKTEAGDDEAPEFTAVVREGTAQHVVGDLAVEDDHGAADEEDAEAAEEPTDRKSPVHEDIILQNA